MSDEVSVVAYGLLGSTDAGLAAGFYSWSYNETEWGMGCVLTFGRWCNQPCT